MPSSARQEVEPSCSRVGRRSSTPCHRRSTCRRADGPWSRRKRAAARARTGADQARDRHGPDPARGVRGARAGPHPAARTSASRSAAPGTRPARSTTSSRPSSRRTGSLLVEVLTPAGNWSSWPPHKHDVDDDARRGRPRGGLPLPVPRPEAWALQRVYRADGSPLGAPRDAVWAVRDGEVVIVTDGYHPFSATDADDAYYLNALAGDRRTMACSFDPALDHVRTRWSGQAPDPRLPLVGPPG